MTVTSDNLGADLLYGVPRVAGFLGITDRHARHLIITGAIPTFRIGNTVCSRRSAVAAILIEREAEAARALVKARSERII